MSGDGGMRIPGVLNALFLLNVGTCLLLITPRYVLESQSQGPQFSVPGLLVVSRKSGGPLNTRSCAL